MRRGLFDLEQDVAGVEMATEVLTLVESLEARDTRQELVRSCLAASDRASESEIQLVVGTTTSLVRDRLEHLIAGQK